jgi:phenylacetate-coenzyme A ligase PaaK-like adenylate-forming protein
MISHEKTDILIDTNPFDFSEINQQVFLESFKENMKFHLEHHEYSRKFFASHNLILDNIKSENDLEDVPGIMVHLYKEHEFCSVDKDKIVLTLTSSGTGGQKSNQFLDQYSLDNVKKLAWNVYDELEITSENTFNYLCFTYDPQVAKDLGTAFTDELLTGFTKKNEVYYGIQWNEKKNSFFLNEIGVLETLKKFEKSEYPTRILGFPALLYELIEKYDLNLDLGSESWLLTGGGWKGKADKEIPKIEFRSLIEKRLGIPAENQRDLFGMVEHGIPYVDCKLGNLHIPNYARVFVRNPNDLKLVPFGETGLLQFLCSYNFSYPAPSLLTSDYGRLGKCECGIGGDILILKGRAGITKHKGCAIKALEVSRG